jgi:hypothetical protein
MNLIAIRELHKLMHSCRFHHYHRLIRREHDSRKAEYQSASMTFDFQGDGLLNAYHSIFYEVRHDPIYSYLLRPGTN